MPFAKALPPGTFSFACQKRTRKAPATFEAREARTRGCSPLVTPKLLGSIQKIQVASLKDFLCSADWKPLSRCATVPSKREPLAKPHALWSAQKLYRTANASLMREVASPTGLDGRSPYPDDSVSRTTRDSSPKWEQAHPQALRSARKLCRHAKGSPFGRAGKPDRA